MVVDSRRQAAGYDGAERMRALLGPPLARAQDAGLVDRRLTVDDVMLAQRMVFGIVVTTVDPADVRGQVSRALNAVGLLPRT
jgi:hypothetical protein